MHFLTPLRQEVSNGTNLTDQPWQTLWFAGAGDRLYPFLAASTAHAPSAEGRHHDCLYENHEADDAAGLPPPPKRQFAAIPDQEGLPSGGLEPRSSLTSTSSSTASSASVPRLLRKRSGNIGLVTPVSATSEATLGPSGELHSSSFLTTGQDVEGMRRRIEALEEALLKATRSTGRESGSGGSGGPVHRTSRSPSDILELGAIKDPFHHVEDGGEGVRQFQQLTHGLSHKTRLFGQSHWVIVVPLFRDILNAIQPICLLNEGAKILSSVQRCKSLARVVKAKRSPVWPTLPTPDLPPRNIADELVECYLASTESILRILQVPAFKSGYESIWSPSQSSTPAAKKDTAEFLVQLKLVLAIGTVTYDHDFSMRVPAIRWIYEAQTWISEPRFKSRLGISHLRTEILLLLARELVGVGGGGTWVAAGTLLRKAISMGLHRDPCMLPKRCVAAAELRRRLWYTVLEICVQASVAAGGSPLVGMEDFDTEPPRNFDDDDFNVWKATDESGAPRAARSKQLQREEPKPKPEDTFTDTSVAIATAKTIPLRLSVCSFLNNVTGMMGPSQKSYSDMLQLEREFRAGYKTLCRTLQGYQRQRQQQPPSPSGPSRFALRALDMQMLRYLSALHVPFFNLALGPNASATYAYSRKVVVDTALKIWRAAYFADNPPPPPITTTAASSSATTPYTTGAQVATPATTTTGSASCSARSRAEDPTTFPRFCTNTTGFYRTASVQASLLLLVELRAQILEQLDIQMDPPSASLPSLPDEEPPPPPPPLQHQSDVDLIRSLQPPPPIPSIYLRPDLLAVIDQVKDRTFRIIQIGETNVKGYILACVVGAQMESLRRGMGKKEISRAMLDAAEKAGREALAFLEAELRGVEGADGGGGSHGEHGEEDFGEEATAAAAAAATMGTGGGREADAGRLSRGDENSNWEAPMDDIFGPLLPGTGQSMGDTWDFLVSSPPPRDPGEETGSSL
ncbi:hypothetical protein MKZ38_002677 [Zalerion maritima]|uniref:Xylanolytic transcriptional activator regulatory domain-containing protein n=1 Tax=Zalerion maritima TaxID=339359 RepID=A0AAD5RNN0_9PEZI|nr:hypothetical protein MKZ38_002677 [Zalerion maritima]